MNDNYKVEKPNLLSAWKIINGHQEPDLKTSQKSWDLINIKRLIGENFNFDSKIDLARFKALQCKESNAWLHSIPSTNIGTFIDNNTLRICIGLRLGCDICSTHTCLCGSIVSKKGLHGLSCQKSWS